MTPEKLYMTEAGKERFISDKQDISGDAITYVRLDIVKKAIRDTRDLSCCGDTPASANLLLKLDD